MEASDSESLASSSHSLDPVFINRILAKKCPLHSKEKSDLLHLTPTSKCSRICAACKIQRKIPDNEIISILEIMKAHRDSSILSMIPNISSDQISQQIQYMTGSIEPLEKKIESFYDQLIIAVEQQINEAREKTKKNLTESVNYYIKNVESVKQTGLIEQLQGILLSTNDDEDEQINEIFQKACNNSKINIAMINNNLNAFNSMKEQYSLGQSHDNQERIQKFIRELDKFPQTSVVPTNSGLQNNNKLAKIDLLESVNVLPYTPRSSQSLQVTREFPAQTLLITNRNEVYSESFLNHQLDKTQKYILRIQLLQNCLNNQPFFTVLLLNSLQDKFKFLFLSNLSYCEIYGGHMTNVLRGQQLWSGDKNIGLGKMIEFRIWLDKKIMRAASYPDFKSVVELYDPSSIDENGQYYIAFNITYPTDSIRIIEFKTVTQFDSSMD